MVETNTEFQFIERTFINGLGIVYAALPAKIWFHFSRQRPRVEIRAARLHAFCFNMTLIDRYA
jgi:hypothetical protein